MLGRSLIRLRLRPDITIALDWDVKHDIELTSKQNSSTIIKKIMGTSLGKLAIYYDL